MVVVDWQPWGGAASCRLVSWRALSSECPLAASSFIHHLPQGKFSHCQIARRCPLCLHLAQEGVAQHHPLIESPPREIDTFFRRIGFQNAFLRVALCVTVDM